MCTLYLTALPLKGAMLPNVLRTDAASRTPSFKSLAKILIIAGKATNQGDAFVLDIAHRAKASAETEAGEPCTAD